MAYYNESVYDAGNSFFEFFDAGNQVSHGLFYGLVIVGGIFFITFMISKARGYQNSVCFVVSSFVGTFTSLIIWLLSGGDYYSSYVLIAMFIIFAVSVIGYKVFES